MKLVWVVVILVLAGDPLLAAPFSEKGQKIRIAMILWRGETPAEKGFKDELASLGYQAEYQTFNAQQNRQLLAVFLRREFEPYRFDYVYSFGTTASLMVKKKLKGKRPQIFNIVADPVRSGLVVSLTRPGKNITGVTHSVSPFLQIQNALRVFPLQRLAILFNSKEVNAEIMKERVELLAKEFSIQTQAFRSPPVKNKLEKHLARLASGEIEVDAVYLPADSYLISRAGRIAEVLSQAGIKSIGTVERYIKQGILLGTVTSYEYLGRQAARILHRHRGGEPLANISVQSDNSPRLIINRKTFTDLQLKKERWMERHFLDSDTKSN